MRKSTRSELEQLVAEVHLHNINVRNREIYIHGAYNTHVEGDPGVEFQMSTTFIKNLHILDSQNNNNILTHIQSPGGDWYDGMAMFNAIRTCKSPVTMIGYAQTSSMSGILLQSADLRLLMPDCMFMIHHGSVTLNNNTIAAKSYMDVESMVCKRMLQIFARRAAKSGKYFKKKKMDETAVVRFIDRKIHNKSDWYLTAQEAVCLGFADGIIGEKYNMDTIRISEKKHIVI